MRKIACLSLVAFVATTMVGCGGGASVPDPVPTAAPVVEPPKPPPPPPPPPPKPTVAPLALKDIAFEFDQADLTSGARRVLDDNARQLKDHKNARVVVEGHCDERGTVEYNLALGQRRAHATMQYLIRKGINASRLSVVSYGEERPVDPGHSERSWSKNRRAHFAVRM